VHVNGTASASVLAGEPRSELRAEVVSDLGPLEAGWGALCDEARAGNVFLSPEWLVPWWKHFGAGREICAIALRDGDRLVGFLPLFREKVRAGGLPITRIAFLGDGATGCDYLDVLAAPGREAEVREAALSALGQIEWDLCDLDGLWRESPTALLLAQRFPSVRPVAAKAAGLGDLLPRPLAGKAGSSAGADTAVVRDARLRFVCPHIPLNGTWPEFLAGLGRRENLRRREKWLFRQPGVSVEVTRTEAEASRAVETFLELHRARWSVEGGSDGLSDQRHESFHREAVLRLARRGWLRLYTLYAARRPVASVYGIVRGSTFLYYQSGYDPAWAQKSVGLVLLARTVEDSFAEKLEDFDFLRGNESYKAQWARAERWTIEVRLFRGTRGRAARALATAAETVRETVKAAIPEPVLEGLRRARRLARAPRGEGVSVIEAGEAALRILSGSDHGA
jgi:CelD/BcsL family acetyltransferase involved in cellulose biosynthesis